MTAHWRRAQYFGSARSPVPRPWLIPCAVFLSLAVLSLLFRMSPVQKVHGWLSPPPAPPPPPPPVEEKPELNIYQLEPEHPGFFDWQTESRFYPIRISATTNKTIAELCASFPIHLLDNIQPVMKTGHGVLDSRVRPHLQSVSACLTGLIIFSDHNETYEGHELIDTFAEIPPSLSRNATWLEAWHNGSLADGTASRKAGWKADKFKFIPAATRAWTMRPKRKWYVFYEADTYVIWDTVFRVLKNFDPDLPYYFGSPSQGLNRTWFANGGPGFILSREAMRRLTQDDFDPETGNFIGDNLLRRFWDTLLDDCCGDSILGWALWNQNVTLSGLWPMMNPHPPHRIPFSESQWCQPVMTMHKPLEQDFVGLWRWEFENRQQDRPLLYRDLAISYFNMTSQTTREDWDNGGWDAFDPPIPSENSTNHAHTSFEACGKACKAHENCSQWTYHLRRCYFNRSFHRGEAKEPGLGMAYQEHHPEESESDWDPEDLRWIAGWDTVKIAKWINERPCNTVKWPRPSTKRIF